MHLVIPMANGGEYRIKVRKVGSLLVNKSLGVVGERKKYSRVITCYIRPVFGLCPEKAHLESGGKR